MSGLAPGLEDISLTRNDAPNQEAYAQPTNGLTVDQYLKIIGDFGPYQIRNYFIVASAWFACSWTTLCMVTALSAVAAGTHVQLHADRMLVAGVQQCSPSLETSWWLLQHSPLHLPSG